MPDPQRFHAVLFVLALALFGAASAQCRFEGPRILDLDLDGVRTVRLATGAGALRVTGSAAADTLTARGRACASSRARLDDVHLTSSRDGNVLVLRTETPRGGLFFGYAHLDLVVVVPDTLPIEIDDGSGDVEVRDVGGRLEVVRDGSGDLRLAGVGGSVEVVRDGSGEIDVTGVGGSVRIGDHASGGIRVENVRGDVRIEEDGSGYVDVQGVGGDFVLQRDGSGSVRYAEVAGTVEVP